jgi:hypothetical protein
MKYLSTRGIMISMRYFILLCLLSSFGTSLISQADTLFGHCGAESLMFDEDIERQYVEALTDQIASRSSDSVTVLPIVIHIIHDNGPENLDDAQVLLAVSRLNDLMRNRGLYSRPTAIDTKLEFCLAKRHIDGSEFNGINRVLSPYTDMRIADQNQRDQMLSMANWDTKQFINIRIVRLVCTTNCTYAGFAGFGIGPVVIYDRLIGQPEYITTLMHELGHYFMLRHTFDGGCKNDHCLMDGDRVCDTPPDNSDSFHCGIPLNTCNTDSDDTDNRNPFRPTALGGIGDQLDRNDNVMDYELANCKYGLTPGQLTRWKYFLHNTYYNHLLESKACLPPCKENVTSDFSISNDTFHIGSIIPPTNTSTSGQSYAWYLGDSLVATTMNPSIALTQKGTFILKLIVTPVNLACDQTTSQKTIHALCPLAACYDYTLDTDTLRWTSCQPNNVTDTITIRDKDNVIVYQSTTNTDLFVLPGPGTYTICQHISNDTCHQVSCHMVGYQSPIPELCTNSLDDDLDGFIDGFDTDCPCTGQAYFDLCDTSCQLAGTISNPIILSKKWESEKVGNGWGNILSYAKNDSIFVMVKKNIGDATPFFNEFTTSNHLLQLDGNTGSTLKDFQYTPKIGQNHARYPFTAFKHNDTIKYILSRYDSLFLMNEDGEMLWKKAVFNIQACAPNVADFNGDGIPEIYSQNRIFSVTNGNILIEDTNLIRGGNSIYSGFPIGSIPSDRFSFGNSNAVDLLPAPGLELAAGNAVYEVVLTNNLSSVGNQLIPHIADTPVQNGITSVGDIDGDGQLDVIVVRNQYFIDGGGIYVWNPRTGAMIAQAPAGESGSIAFIGDVDGVCGPEIGVVFVKELRMYRYNGSTTLELMYSLPTTDRSGWTGITMFDFNQDGRNELVYRDETTLRIIEGISGTTLVSTPMKSGTDMEYPIVVDIDNDGQAEILTTGYMPGEQEEDSRVYCFESGGAPWAPARSVWNQYGYHVTNVNDDLTIPRQQQNMAQFFDTDSCAQQTCPQPYNAFMTQATYRTQKGCRVWPSLPDLSISATVSCVGDSLDMCFIIKGRLDTMRTIPMSCYPVGNNPIDTLPLETIILSQDTTCIRIPRFIDINTIAIVINDRGGSFPARFDYDMIECRYDNNIFLLSLPDTPKSLDLGPDLSSCLGKVVSLDAGDFETYRWSDESTDATLTTGDKGIYWVEATDNCGRIYRDSVVIDIIPSVILALPTDTVMCPGQSISYSLPQTYDQVYWLPADKVDCDTCATVRVTSGQDIELTVFATKDGCIGTDTVDIRFVPLNHISLGPDARYCPGFVDSFIVRQTYDSIRWSPATSISCDTCRGMQLLGPDDFTLSIEAYRDGCVTRDTVGIDYIQRVDLTKNITLCENQIFTYGDSTWTQSGRYTYQVGQCDSLLTFDIKTYQDAESNRTLSICAGDSILLQGLWRTDAGDYTDVLTSYVGCDSLVKTKLDILPVRSTQASYELCAGKTINIHGIDRNVADTYPQIFTAANGCDSTSTITLSYLPPINTSDSIWICQNESVIIHGMLRNIAGSYDQSFKTAQGCDSTSQIYLTVSPYKLTDKHIGLCEGDSLEINDKYVKLEGVYDDTLFVSIGCDEIIRHHVSILRKSVEYDAKLLCPNLAVPVNGQIIATTGVYTFTGFVNADGCDSTYILEVREVPPSLPPTIQIDCNIPEYTVTIPKIADWRYFDKDMPNGVAKEVYKIGKEGDTLRLSAKYIFYCNENYLTILPQLPTSNDIPSISDQQQIGSSGISLAIDLDPKQWRITWSPAALVSCDTCLSAIVSTPTDTTMTIQLTHISGCTFEKSFRIVREKNIDITVPNIINPQSISGNDLWTVRLPQGYTAEAHVYDRWGDNVYATKPTETIAWNGKHLGQFVSQGVYIYILKVIDPQGNVTIMKGDVTVVF